MKRKDMILLVSLDLFNELGESNVTSVDIANEMDISPGNLYYHFKGKEEIIAALVEHFGDQLDLLTQQDEEQVLLLSSWLRMYFILETVYKNRFFLRNIPDILFNYEDSGKELVRILDSLRKHLVDSITKLADHEEVMISSVQKNLITKLVNSVMLVIIYWDSFQTLNRQTFTENEFIQDASLQILSLLSPYLTTDQIRDIHQLHQQYLRDKISLPA